MDERDDYLIDVAADRVYQNQGRKYHDAFTAWRNDADNKYGYCFVHDSREHIYVDGEGYADARGATAEHNALFSCLRLLAGLMIFMFFMEQIEFLMMRLFYENAHIDWVLFSQRTEPQAVSSQQVYFYCGFRVLILLLAILILQIKLNIPVQIVMPHEKVEPMMTIYHLLYVLVFIVIFHVCDYAFSYLLVAIRIDSDYYIYMKAATAESQLMYMVINMIITPMLLELLFRGYIMQLFRQFGDYFAIFVAAVANAFMYHDVNMMMSVFGIGVILGVITIKTGSIFPALFSRVATMNIAYLLNTLGLDHSDGASMLFEILICLGVLVVSMTILIYMRLRYTRPFKIEMQATEISIQEKLREVLNSVWIIIWLILTLVTTILSVEFI